MANSANANFGTSILNTANNNNRVNRVCVCVSRWVCMCAVLVPKVLINWPLVEPIC